VSVPFPKCLKSEMPFEPNSNILTADEIEQLIGPIDLKNFELMRADSYSDPAIAATIKKTKMERELLCCAIQTAVIGMGNKVYGKVKIDGKEQDIDTIYRKCGVKMRLEQGSKLEPGDLTGRRIQRFYRKYIYNFIKNSDVQPYLWRKYTTQKDEYRQCCFPGAEHLLTDKHEIDYLLSAYKRLDELQGTRFLERMQRVFGARGIQVVAVVPVV